MTSKIKTKGKKRKNAVLAALFGLVLGPLGTIYFGWRVFLPTIVTVVLCNLLIIWVIPLDYPVWLPYLTGVFFAFWNYALCHLWNESIDEEDNSSMVVGINLVGLEGWYIRFLGTSMGLYLAYTLILDGRWFAALVGLFFLVPISIVIFENTLAFILALIVTWLDR